MNFDSLITDNFNAFTLALLGMSVVFTGLTIVALYIAALPKILGLFERKTKIAEVTEVIEAQDEIVVAVATAFHIHQRRLAKKPIQILKSVFKPLIPNENLSDQEKLVWQAHPGNATSWQMSGRMINFSLRNVRR